MQGETLAPQMALTHSEIYSHREDGAEARKDGDLCFGRMNHLLSAVVTPPPFANSPHSYRICSSSCVFGNNDKGLRVYRDRVITGALAVNSLTPGLWNLWRSAHLDMRITCFNGSFTVSDFSELTRERVLCSL